VIAEWFGEPTELPSAHQHPERSSEILVASEVLEQRHAVGAAGPRQDALGVRASALA
jgi:hypothetical protein